MTRAILRHNGFPSAVERGLVQYVLCSRRKKQKVHLMANII